ncbi:MAG: MmgE/PrpD family protein [Chloroflexi bacterium]|nr:MmgE/PrpD family protein [Chloroflexota bacterium]
MTLQRDLAWQKLDLVYRSSVAHQFARYALALNYDLIAKDAIHQAKRCLLDTLGVAIGAWEAPGRPICAGLVDELGGKEEATMFGTGTKTSAANAALFNAFLVRYLDSNDLGGGGHNSDSISSILAVAEREKADGKGLLTSIVISYELGQRFADAIVGGSMEDKGLNIDIRGGLNVPPSLGKLMGLDEEQIANAIGVCASHAVPLKILDGHREDYTMAKNLRFGWVAHDAIMACILAKRGFTGPRRVIEGDCGYLESVLRGEMDLERMVDFSGWRILKVRHKTLCTNGTNHGNVLATLAIVKEHDLKPEDIAAVKVKTIIREATHTATPAKKYPRNGESADHSTYYANAHVIKERTFGPEAFQPHKFTDPVILGLIEKITVEADPTLTGYQAISEITTTDGRRFVKRIDCPHGFGNDPLTDKEIEEKFAAMTSKHFTSAQIKKVCNTVWDAEKLKDVGKLTELMVFPKK